jgi:hypothetical protein
MPMATGGGWGVKSGGTPFNSYTDVIAGLQRSGRLQVRIGAHALGLEHDESGRVNRVVYYDRATNSEASIACKAVVLVGRPDRDNKAAPGFYFVGFSLRPRQPQRSPRPLSARSRPRPVCN